MALHQGKTDAQIPQSNIFAIREKKSISSLKDSMVLKIPGCKPQSYKETNKQLNYVK